MSAIFKALANLPKREPKKHFVTVDGEKYEVPFEKHQWAIQQGFENLMIKNGEIVLKPPRKIQVRYSELSETEKEGYFFEDNDIHWPTRIAQGGLSWQIKSE